MATFITPFDPTLAPSGSFPISLANGGWLMIHNDSPAQLTFKTGVMTAPVLVPAYTARCFQAPLSSMVVNWTKVATLTLFGSPISQVYVEAYEPLEWQGGEVYLALARLENPQERNVCIPAGMQQWTQGTGSLPAAAGNSFIIGVINLSAANITNQISEAYLSALFFQVGEPAQGAAQLQLDWIIRNAGGTVLTSIGILPFTCYSPGLNTGVGTVIDRVWPLPLNFERSLIGLVAPFDVALRVTLVAASPGLLGAPYNFHATWWLDLVNTASIASPGNPIFHTVPGTFF
jgi:hypothetical protein